MKKLLLLIFLLLPCYAYAEGNTCSAAGGYCAEKCADVSKIIEGPFSDCQYVCCQKKPVNSCYEFSGTCREKCLDDETLLKGPFVDCTKNTSDCCRKNEPK